MTQIVEPLALIAMEKKVLFKLAQITQEDPINALKALLLKDWYKTWEGHKDALDENHWIFKVNKVELIECELLVPRNKWIL